MECAAGGGQSIDIGRVDMLDPERGEFRSQVVHADKQHIRTLGSAIQCDRSQQEEGGQQRVHDSDLPRQSDMDSAHDPFGGPARRGLTERHATMNACWSLSLVPWSFWPELFTAVFFCAVWVLGYSLNILTSEVFGEGCALYRQSKLVG